VRRIAISKTADARRDDAPMAILTRRLRGALIFFAGFLAVAWTTFPFVWALLLSFKRSQDFLGAKYIPWRQFHPTLANWRLEWAGIRSASGLGDGLIVSTEVALLATVFALGLGGLAAIGLLRCEWDGVPRWPIVGLVLVPRIVPPIVLVFPFSTLMRDAHLSDTNLALAIAHSTLALPLTVLLLTAALRDIPRSLADAAQLDGASWWRIGIEILFPLILPVVLAAGILAFAVSWNEYLFAVTNHDLHASSAPLAIDSLEARDGVQFEYVGSHLVLVLLPPMVLALLAQRFIVRGLTLGAISG
jgi:multiple sugar transport system permease protein